MTRTVTADLHLDSLGNLVMEEGLEAVRQRILQRLRFARGEWFLEPEEGVPYFDVIFTEGFDAGLVAQVIVAELSRIPSVDSIEVVSATLDPPTRRTHLVLHLQTSLGDMVVEEDI